MFKSRNLMLVAFSLMVSSLAHATPDVSLVCTPEVPLANQARVGWNTLVAIDSVKVDFLTLELTTRYLDANDSNREKSESVIYNAQISGGMYATFSPKSSRSLEFSSVGLGIREVKAPMSAGPIAEGDHPATATLVLVTEFYPTVGADKQIEVVKVNLSCLYKVRYR